MRPRPMLLAALVLGTTALALSQTRLAVITEAWAACDPGTKIDKTTVKDTRDRLIKAGYRNPTHLRKGCDNTWHGTATKDGEPIDLAVLPDGTIVRDGD